MELILASLGGALALLLAHAWTFVSRPRMGHQTASDRVSSYAALPPKPPAAATQRLPPQRPAIASEVASTYEDEAA